MRRAALFMLLALMPSLAAADSWTLVGSDFQSRAVTLLSLDASGVKVADADGSAAHVVGWDKILELEHVLPPAATTPAASPFTLRLNGGDGLGGSPVSVADDKIIWQQTLLGKMEIPEDRAGAIVRTGSSLAGIDDPRKADSVRLANGDAVTGVLQSFGDDGAAIQSAGADAPVQIGTDKIAAILLADSDPTASPGGGAAATWRVWLSDGSSLAVPLATLTAGDGAKLAIGFSADKLSQVELSAVSSIELLNGPVRWLTELTPASVVYHPYLEESFPPQFDHPVDDATVSIRSRFPSFRHGIGVHSYTRLTYAVPDGFGSFRTQFAIERIDGSDMTKADVTVRLLLDGKVAREFTHVRYGGVAEAVSVDVSGSKELAVEVDYGDNLDAQDRFVWLDPAFIRAAQATRSAP